MCHLCCRLCFAATLARVFSYQFWIRLCRSNNLFVRDLFGPCRTWERQWNITIIKYLCERSYWSLLKPERHWIQSRTSWRTMADIWNLSRFFWILLNPFLPPLDRSEFCYRIEIRRMDQAPAQLIDPMSSTRYY